MLMKTQTLAIDFDGTLCRKQGFGDGTIYEEPNKGAKEVLDKMKEEGYKIVIYSTRLNPKFDRYTEQLEEVANWLEKYSIPFDEITPFKPRAIAYIDDRAVRFTNWFDMKNLFVQ